MSKFIFFVNVAVAGMVVLTGCSGGKEKAMGPEETVETFCRAMATGEWKEAEALCDTVSMREYLNSYKDTWEVLLKEEGRVMEIAQVLLAETATTIKDVRREDDRRIVSYTLTVDGNCKTREATLRKEEGAWRVERISDAL
jgi:hypothetical protein